MTLEEVRLQDVIHQITGELGVALHAATVVAGQKLGLFRALATVGPGTVAEIALASSCSQDLVERWLIAQYLSGYCQFSPQTRTYWMSPEQRAVLDPASPAYLLGAVQGEPRSNPVKSTTQPEGDRQ